MVNGPLLSDENLEILFQTAIEQSFRSIGAGSFYSQYQSVLSGHDRFGVNPILPNHEVTGLTFITRPKLNLTTPSIRQDRILSMLDIIEPKSLAFVIRALLDTKFAKVNRTTVSNSPFINGESPFIVPLSNCLVSMSGWPDPVIDTETTEGGFFSEDLTFAKGSDRLARSYDFTLTFRDIQGGFILALLYIWIRFKELVTRGDVIAYPEDIVSRRLCYTCSIYRFILDPSRQFITGWAKATGCFPKSVPLGAKFNINERETFISSAQQYSVPFTVNHVSYMDPIIFREFNTLVNRTCPDIDNRLKSGSLVYAPIQPDYNFTGIPYIDTSSGMNMLNFVCSPSDLENPLMTTWNNILSEIGLSGGGSNSTGTSVLGSGVQNDNAFNYTPQPTSPLQPILPQQPYSNTYPQTQTLQFNI